jgi:hypothetical protein
MPRTGNIHKKEQGPCSGDPHFSDLQYSGKKMWKISLRLGYLILDLDARENSKNLQTFKEIFLTNFHI